MPQDAHFVFFVWSTLAFTQEKGLKVLHSMEALGACVIKYYSFVMYRKLRVYVISKHFFQDCQSLSLAWTNTLAYYRSCILQTSNALYYRPLVLPTNIWPTWKHIKDKVILQELQWRKKEFYNVCNLFNSFNHKTHSLVINSWNTKELIHEINGQLY